MQLQFLFDTGQCLVNEQHPSVLRVVEFVQNFSVENENRFHRQSALQGLEKSVVIIQSQVSPEPENIMLWSGRCH